MLQKLGPSLASPPRSPHTFHKPKQGFAKFETFPIIHLGAPSTDPASWIFPPAPLSLLWTNLMSDNIAENNVGEVGAVSNNEKYQYPLLAPWPYYAASNTNNYIPPPSYVELGSGSHHTPNHQHYKYLTN